jgi:O-antigen/teichoic acid export membrane protein
MSIKRNFFYSGILAVSNYLFPFLTFPYISRVLGVDNLGKCSFVDGIVGYFLLFASLGIGAVGIREIAKCKDDKGKLEGVFSSLLLFNFITTIIVSVIYVAMILFLTKFEGYRELLFIGLAKIISSLFLIEWFYAGIENFKFITSRSIIIRAIYVVLIFILVREPDDYKVYFFLTVAITVINAVINIYYSRRFVRFSFKDLAVTKFIKPVITMGIYSLLTYMYTSFNVIYLGLSSGDREVGYYTTATKIYTILLSVFTAFTTVMLPRISQMVVQKKEKEIQILIDKSYDALFLLSIPIIFICTSLAPHVVAIIAGDGFRGAIVPMMIVMPLILIIGIAQILIIQILMPFSNDRTIFINSLIGAIVGIAFNIILVTRFHSTGSAIALLLSELAVVISANYFVRKYINFTIPYIKMLKNITVSIPYLFFCWVANVFFEDSMVVVLSVLFLSSVYLALIQKFLIKNPLLMELASTIKGVVVITSKKG